MKYSKLAVLATIPILFGAAACAADPSVAVPPKVETKTVTKEVTPPSCLQALTDADTVIATAGEGFTIVAEAMTAASTLDTDGIEAATEKLTALNTDKLTPAISAYRASRDSCRSAAN